MQSALAVASFLRLRLPLFRSHHNLTFCVTALSKKPSAPVNPHFIYRSAQTTDEASQCHRRRLRQRWGKWEVTQRGLPDPREGFIPGPSNKSAKLRDRCAFGDGHSVVRHFYSLSGLIVIYSCLLFLHFCAPDAFLLHFSTSGRWSGAFMILFRSFLIFP